MDGKQNDKESSNRPRKFKIIKKLPIAKDPIAEAEATPDTLPVSHGGTSSTYASVGYVNSKDTIKHMIGQPDAVGTSVMTKYTPETIDASGLMCDINEQTYDDNLIRQSDDDDDDDATTGDSDVEEDSAPRIDKRKRLIYDETQMQDMADQCEIYKRELSRMTRGGRYKCYPNQTSDATIINNNFNESCVVIQMAIGYTQSGKTGCMAELIYKIISNQEVPISLELIFVITGLSSTEWEKQTKGRFPPCMESRVFHNGKLDDFKKKVKGKKNVLVIIDEAHMASKKKQTMSKIFKTLSWNLDYMMENDIKLVQFSATPDGLIFALTNKKWPEKYYKIITMKPGEGYFGAKQMDSRDQLKQNKDIYGRDKQGAWINDEVKKECLKHIKDILNDQLSFKNMRYLLCRVRGGLEDNYHKNFIDALATLSKEDRALFAPDHMYKKYYMNGNVDDIMSELSNPPQFHTMVYLKEKMKCAQTLEFVRVDDVTGETITQSVKDNIGVVVERRRRGDNNKQNDSFIIQGLLGRLCGYEAHACICYTNLTSYEKYEKLMNREFNIETLSTVFWNSNTTSGKSRGGTTHKININDEPVDVVERNKSDKQLLASPIFGTREEVIKWVKNNLKSEFTKNTYNVGEYNSDGTKNKTNNGTHAKPRGELIEIPTKKTIENGYNLTQQYGGGNRIIPVKMEQAHTPNHYTIIYKPEWLVTQNKTNQNSATTSTDSLEIYRQPHTGGGGAFNPLFATRTPTILPKTDTIGENP
jgi:hypothetical protein